MEKPNFVGGEGPIGAKLMIVGEAPGREESEQERPFVGQSGEMVNEVCKEAGFNREDCYVTNVVKYRPPNNDFTKLHEIGVSLKQQEDFLWTEIKRIRPNCILALGDKALHAVTGWTGVSKLRGSILQSKIGNIPKVVSSIHPANLIPRGDRKPWPYVWKSVMVGDFLRAYEESKTNTLRLPARNLMVANNALDVYRFIQRHRGRIKDGFPVFADIESMHCIPVCVGLAFNKHEALSIPLYNTIRTNVKQRKGAKKVTTSAEFTELRLAKYSNADRVNIWRQLDDFFRIPGLRLGGQNWKYDQDKLEMFGFRFPNRLYVDTSFGAHTINPEMPYKGLAFLASCLTREPFWKDEGSEFNPHKDDISRYFLYNAKDCAVNYEVWEEIDKEIDYLSDLHKIPLRKFFYEYVMRLHHLYMGLEARGIRIDDSAREFLIHKYQMWDWKLQESLNIELGHPLNVNSNAKGGQVWHTLYNELRCHQYESVDENTITALLANHIKDERRKVILNDILVDRRVKKTLSTTITAAADFDGRMRTQVRVTGTETARSSNAVLKPPIRPVQCGIPFQTLTKHGDIGADAGLMLVPDEGHIFVKIDLSQAEPRIVAVLSKDWELVKVFEQGKIDIHRRTAGLIFEYINSLELDREQCSNDFVDRIPKDDPMRFMGKKTRNGGAFDMGKRELMLNINADAKRFHIDANVSEWRAGKLLERFHASSPNVREVFHHEVQQQLDENRTLINPFGRPRIFFERWGRQMFKEAYAQIPQSTVHDRLTSCWIKLEDEMPNASTAVIEAHDALTFHWPIDEVDDRSKVVKKIFEEPIDFSLYCSLKRDYKLTIPVDFEIAENLAEFKKLKVA